MSNVVSKIGNIIGKSINTYHNNILKPRLDDLKFKEEYQGRIIDCMLGEVDDNYITTPETDAPIVKLEYSREGLIKVPTIKGKTMLVDEDGNETDTPAEGCKLVSVGESEDNKLIILSRNKNLFDGEIERYFINSSTGQNNGWVEYWRSKDYIRCTPNEKYLIHFKYKGVKKNGAMFFYDKDKNYIGMTYNNPTTTPSNCEFIRISGQAENTGTLIDITKVTDIMFCKGVDISDYIESKHHKTEILLNEPLRSLPNGVCDEIVGNKIVRRVGRVILNTDKNWVERDRYSQENVVAFEITDENILLPKTNGNDAPIGDIIQGKPYNVIYYSPIEGVGIKHYNNKTVARVNIDYLRLITQDVDGFKQWLSENPITVLYELAEPIIEELPNSITLQGFDDTTMYIENSITPTVQYGYNALIPYKEELSQQKEEVETNTLDIENNIIPYLMDMEFNLMNMEDK